MKRALFCFTVGLCVWCAVALIVRAGSSIDPPTDAFDGGGNPKANMKSLNDVEPRNAIETLPYMVTNPGSYYFVRNMTATSNITGLTIQCSDVSIDLRGFALIGCTNSLDGIKVDGTNENICIENGSVRQWGGYGINAETANDSTIEKVKANRNALGGIVFGDGAIITRCSAFGNGYKAPLPPAFIEQTIVDTDNDGMEDQWELDWIANVNSNDAIVTINDVDPWMDFDMDGIMNIDEFNQQTDPGLNEQPDSDYDGMDDAWEQTMIADDDPGDAISNHWDVWYNDDYDGDGAWNIDEFHSGTDPADTNSVDMDYDGMLDSFEMQIVNDDTNDTIYDIYMVHTHSDYDLDFVSNWDEYQAGTDPTDPASKPAVSGVQTNYAQYTEPPTGPMYDTFDDPTDEPSDDGIRAGGYSSIKDCKARGNRGSGIYVQYGSRVVSCTVAGNCTEGIRVTDFCTVLECTSARNKRDGITIGSKCRVKDNNSGQNGDFAMEHQSQPEGAGIRILGAGNRVEANNLSGNAIGIKVDDAYSYEYGAAGMSGGRNLIILNSLSDNWGMAFDLSGGDYMGGTMYQGDVYDAASTNNNAMMDSNNPFSNFNF